MNDPDPIIPAAPKPGLMDLAKRIAGRAAETAQSVRQPMPDRTPGVRWLRKHKVSDPRPVRVCVCRGCSCGRPAVDVCRPCASGRHVVSLRSKADRRARAGPSRSIARVDPHRRSPAQHRKPHRRGKLDSVRAEHA